MSDRYRPLWIVVLCLYLFVGFSLTPAMSNDGKDSNGNGSAASLPTALESSAAEIFRALMADVEICESIVINNDWSSVEGRQEVIIDDVTEEENIGIRVRVLLAEDGLTQIRLTEVLILSENEVNTVVCSADTQQPQTSSLKTGLQIEFTQWANELLDLPGRRMTSCGNKGCGNYTPGVYWCDDDEIMAYIMSTPYGEKNLVINFTSEVRPEKTCPLKSIAGGEGKRAKKRLTALMEGTLGRDVTFSLDDCNLSISTKQISDDENAPTRLTRSVQSIDLKLYSVDEPEIISSAQRTSMEIKRKQYNDDMFDQAKAVFTAENTYPSVVDDNRIQESLSDNNNTLFLRYIAELEIEDDKLVPIVQEDAPAFFELSQRVEALPKPASFISITSYSQEVSSAENFLSGEIVAIPPLRMSLANEEAANEIANALQQYTIEYSCQ